MCHNLNEKAVEKALDEGVRNVEDLTSRLGIELKCRTCENMMKAMVERIEEKQPARS
jgi:bacterioferritin-associated ferredoxin